MSENYEFLSLQGSSHLARNINGKATVLRELGNQTSCKLSISSETTTLKETKTGKRQDALVLTKSRSVNLEIVMDERKRDDIALAFQAESIKTTGGTITDKVLDELQAGDEIKLDGINLTDVVITDKNSTTLNEGEHYELDADYGTIKLLKTEGLTQPLKCSYTQGDTTSTVLFSLPDNAEYYYLFKGINSIDDKRLMVEIWRFKPSVDGELELINDEVGQISVKGSALADTTKQQDAKLGGLGRIVYLD